MYTLLDSARNMARSARPTNRSRFREVESFFSAPNKLKFCTLVDQALNFTFSEVTKMKKIV